MSLTEIINSLGGAVGNIYGAVKGTKTPAAPSPVAANPSATGTATAKAWLPYALGGGVLLLVIVLILSFRKS